MKRWGFLILMLALMPVAVSAQDVPVLTMQEAVDLALENNHGLAADRYDWQSTNWATAESVSAYLPHVYFTTRWTRMDQESVDEANAYVDLANQAGQNLDPVAWEDSYSSSMVVNQPIFNGGAELSNILANNAQRKERKYNYQNSRATLIRDVKRAYVNLYAAQELAGVAKETLALSEQTLAYAKAREELGQISRAEVLRWEAQKAEQEGALIEAENTIVNGSIALANLMGQELENRYKLVMPPENQLSADLQQAATQSSGNFPAVQAVQGHPSVKQADQAVTLSKVGEFSSVGKLLPNINFSYSYAWETNDTLELDGEDNWTAGINFEIPIFQSLGGVFGIVKSHKTVAKSKQSRTDYTRSFLQQLHMAQLTLRSAKAQVEAAQKAQAFAKENLDIVSERHKLGMASNLDLLDAQVNYSRARSNFIRNVATFYGALADHDYLLEKSDNQ